MAVKPRGREHAVAPWRTLPEPPDDGAHDLAWKELGDQFHWYDHAANRNRNVYLLLKIPAMLLGGVVTILAATKSSAVLTASLAAAIVAAEGIQQLFRLQPVWISYRGTADALRRAAMSYAMQVTPYDDPETRRTILADATRTITTGEFSNWAETMQQPPTS
jgi:hypothetical protein